MWFFDLKWVLAWFLGWLALLGFGCMKGDSSLWTKANPQTEITVNPLTKTITVFNNKDVDVTLDEFSGHGENTSWTVKNLIISDKSSPVREADALQLEMAERITAAAFKGAGDVIARIVSPLIGASADVDTPIGGGSVRLGTGTPTTQPAAPSDSVETGGAGADGE